METASMVEGASLIHILQQCRLKKDLHFAHCLHAYMCQQDVELHPVYGNRLVSVLVDCGGLADAQHVFDRLPDRNERSWTSLISGYSSCGQPEQAFHLYLQMQLENSAQQPTRYTYVPLLIACGKLQDLERSRGIHNEIIRRGLETDVYLGSTLVDVYAKCGSLTETQQLFDMMPIQNVVSWTSLITGYAEHAIGEEALKLYRQMQLNDVLANALTFASCLKACCKMGALETGQELHTEIIRRGLEKEAYVSSTLINMYTRCGLFGDAQLLFDDKSARNAISWSAVIAGYTDKGLSREVLNCFKQMQQEGVSADALTFILCLKAFCVVRDLETGKEIHAEIRKSGFERDPVVGNMLVDMYGKCGSVAEGLEVFDKLHVRDVVSWTAVINAYIENEDGEMALQCFRDMQEQGVYANAVTFVLCLKACATVEALTTGRELHAEIAKRGLERDVAVGNAEIGNALVDMYSKCGSLIETCQVFDKLPFRNAVSWTALIAGYAKHGFNVEVLNCFTRLQLEGVLADAVTYLLCLKACGTIGALDTGCEIHAEIRKSGLEGDLFLGSMLVDMYGKCGCITEGRKVFDNLPVRDAAAWTSMINTYGENHEGNMAVQCFEEMQEQGIKPDSVTFSALLAACSHANLFHKGQEYFKLMRGVYEIEPSLNHYACMVDLLARSGHIYEAERFVEGMHCAPTCDILIPLISACKLYGKVDQGERCFQQLLKLNKEDATAYLLMGDIYSSVGRWTDANKTETMRKTLGTKKKPGGVLLEVNKRLHEFVAGANSRCDTFVNSQFLIAVRRNEGYIPNLDLVLGCLLQETENISDCR